MPARPGRLLSKTVLMPTAIALLALFAQPAFARDSLQTFLLAARADDVSVVAQMPGLGLDERLRDDLGNTLLMVAIREGGERLALSLLRQPLWQQKALLEQENRLGENALMLASIKGLRPVAEALIQHGAEVNREGWTALHYAATSGHVDLIQLLTEQSAYVDAASPNGTTPIMMAVRFNHRPAAAALIAAGADPTQSNQAGLTARDYAIQNNNKDLAFWIEGEEIAFTNRYLKRLAKPSVQDSEVIKTGSANLAKPSKDGVDVVTVVPSKPPVVEEPRDKSKESPKDASKDTVKDTAKDIPKGDVEVFGGIR